MKDTRSIIKQLFIFSFFITGVLNVSAEKQDINITWLPPYEVRFSEDELIRTINFSGIQYSSEGTPVYVITGEVPQGFNSMTAELFNMVSEPLKEKELIREGSIIPNDFIPTVSTSYRKKKPFYSISIPVIRKIGSNYEKLMSFSINYNGSNNSRLSSNTTTLRQYATNSVLASGTFYKFGVTQNGIYKIDYQYLRNMGVDVTTINPRNIRIYGNGGGMLPMLNNLPRYDDLKENAIFVFGEADGRFDEDDYILFYGTSQTSWIPNAANLRFTHQLNYYADSTFYFLTFDHGQGTRIVNRQSEANPNLTVNTYNDFIFQEAELYNLLKSGREWYGQIIDYFNNSISVNFNIPNISTTEPIYVRSDMAGRTTVSNSSSFSLSVNGNNIGSQTFSRVGTTVESNYVSPAQIVTNFNSSSGTLNFNLTLNTTDANAQGWLNYIEINFRRQLNATGLGNFFLFRDFNSVGAGNIASFNILNGSGLEIWDVTDRTIPIRQQTSTSGTGISFNSQSDSLREYAAFIPGSYLTPGRPYKIANQNLHNLAAADLLIVTHPNFLAQANDLAALHRSADNLSVAIATTSEIYNEFSSGAQDVSAVRDFAKMFYDRAASGSGAPKYLLLFGDASYDPKNRVANNSNFVICYQSPGSINQTQTYISDDFFGLLDDNEGNFANNEMVDISIGRLPARNIGEAQAMVNKIRYYMKGNGVSNPTYGNWRNTISFVADDQNNNIHFNQAETLAERVRLNYPLYNIDKIYIDAYNQETTPGGQRYPDAHNAINSRVSRGALLMTYIGHGNEINWAQERILEVADINSWTNLDNMPAFLTATCEFTRVDDPSRTSAGELIFLNPNGGGIGLFTTSRVAYSGSNYTLCTKFFTHVFDRSLGRFQTMGEVFEKTKVDVFSDVYVRNFILIGDPALKLAYPEYKVRTLTINGVDINQPTDTLKALSRITITGEVTDNSGNRLTTYNGFISPTVFDKRQIVYTLGNDRNILNDPSTSQPFTLQKNIIYSGNVSVTNGSFSFTFVVPKDISFQVGNGKISYYAYNNQSDAAGFDTLVKVGGINMNAPQDNVGPQVKLFMNDEKFIRGGMTDANPYLYAIITDSSGINTVGTGIGHDMSAILNNQTNNKYILNDYYENDLNSFQTGRVRYPFKNLAPGTYTVDFKVWDVYNNSSDATTEFVVSESAELALQHVLNYPNPFTTHTTFMFEHNRPFAQMDVQVQVFTVSGKLIKTLSTRIIPTGYRSEDIEWDGLDDFGDKIGRGVYVYKLRVRTSDGQYADKFEKLVILR